MSNSFKKLRMGSMVTCRRGKTHLNFENSPGTLSTIPDFWSVKQMLEFFDLFNTGGWPSFMTLHPPDNSLSA